jgi:branched-chain amino acid transport system permease protein
VALDASTLTFLVLYALAATLVAQLRSIVVAFVAAVLVGLIEEMLTPIQSLTNYRDMTPFVIAIAALLWQNRRATVSLTREGI